MTIRRPIAAALFAGSLLAACNGTDSGPMPFASYGVFSASVREGTSKGTMLEGSLLIGSAVDDTLGGGFLFIPAAGGNPAQTIGVTAVIAQSSIGLTFALDGGKTIKGTGPFTGTLAAGPDSGQGTLTGPAADDKGDWAFSAGLKNCTPASQKKSCQAQAATCVSMKQYDPVCVTKTTAALNAIGTITSTHTTDFTSRARELCCDQLITNTVADCKCNF